MASGKHQARVYRYADGTYHEGTELDPFGVSVGVQDPYVNNGYANTGYDYPGVTEIDPEDPYFGAQCIVDGLYLNCPEALDLVRSEAAAICPDNDCGPHSVLDEHGNQEWSFVAVNDQGEAGYWGYELGRSQQTGVDYLPNPNHPDDVGTVYFSSWDVVKTWHHSANMAGRLPHGGDGDPGTGTTSGHGDPQETVDTNQLRNDIKMLLTNPKTDCGNFVKSLIKEASNIAHIKPISDDVLDLFDRIKNQGGFIYGEPPNGFEKWQAGAAEGTIKGKDAAVYFKPNIEGLDYAELGLGEILHLAAKTSNEGFRYSDRTYALAVEAIGGPKAPAILRGPPKINLKRQSTFFHGELAKHCHL